MIGHLYGFFQRDFKSSKYFLTIGKSVDWKHRENTYKITNANISFDYLKEVKYNYLTEAESDLIKYLKEHFSLWKTSMEQFEVGNSELDVAKAEKILLNVMYKVKTKGKDVAGIEYEYGTLFGTKDVRDLRKTCTFIPGKVSMITTKAGVKEKLRTYLTKYQKKGRRLLKLQREQRVPVSNYAWDIIQIVQSNEREKQRQREEFENNYVKKNII